MTSSFRFEPLISKKFQMENMVLTPYGSLPLGLRTRNSEINDDGLGRDVAVSGGHSSAI